MRKKFIYLMCIAMASTVITSCSKQQEETEQNPVSQESASLKIAYVEIDSLMENYQFCKDYSEMANIEGQNIQNTLTSKQRTLEQHAAAMQKKYETNGFTSQEELTRAQQSLQNEQQSLQELSDRLTATFQEEQAKYNEEMRDSIQSFLKQYNKTKKYDLILSKAGDNMLLANPAMDITKDVLKGLNKRYKIKPEVADKIKSAKK